MRNQQNVKVKVNSTFETICPFPVGYVYMSSNSTSPSSIYGGTWASISGGKYMRAADDWSSGGSNTITTNNMPSHSHKINTNLILSSREGSQYGLAVSSAFAGRVIVNGGNEYAGITISSTGGGSILPHLPKCLGVVQNCLKKVMLRA